ncbi:hypothetical protein D6029_21545 [Buttiauxella izardii]|uniref:DUF1281 domain-containing protein n=1 Tax=Buttiauxella izardii TaxID=82991 RepID=A0A3A5JLK1_9ENTR|nr:hypothetical protein D6029_21545 [Buttiauxella izardii]
MQRMVADWFGIVELSDGINAAACWEQLAVMPERSVPCDMLQVLPTRLCTELTGTHSRVLYTPAHYLSNLDYRLVRPAT